MKKIKYLKLTSIIAIIVMMVMATACSSLGNEAQAPKTDELGIDSDDAKNLTVEITDIHGTVTVPVNPKNVVALDNRTFETLSDWGIELVAVPKSVMPVESPYVSDDTVQDIGNHREPNLEIIAALEPELVIIGQRFASFYEEIKALVPDAAVIDLNFDISEEADSPGENLLNGLVHSTISLGQIFDKNNEAEKLVADFEKAMEDAKSAYNGTDTVMSVIVSGGNIGFSAPGSGRVWGPMYEIFNWVPALSIDNSTSDHQGDDISVEAIAQSNPDWIFVLDRDASVSSSTDAVPAQDIIDNSPALQNNTAVIDKNIVYAPNDTYVNESIQTYLELFGGIVAAFAN
ncbi:MAG: ABC transporter substrate-binding protein [Clostridiales bacterium]|nr:ABC transporter substrate-binding protein [Clostridiales bacterium]